MKRARWIPVLIGAAGVLTSCGDGVSPPTTGSIALLISVAETQARSAAPDLSRTGQVSPRDSTAAITPPELSVAGYTTARATAAGPTNKSIDLTLTDGFWEGELTDLNEGSYTVTVQGLVDGALAAQGVTSGVTVTAGNQATASVTLTSVIPTLSLGIGSPTTSLEIPVSVTAVDGASAYRIQWSTNPDFTGAASKDITETTGTVSVSNLGTYNIRASAVLSGAAGAPSPAVAVEVAGDTPATGDDPGTALGLGFGPNSTQQLTALNIAPTGDEDWFQLNACRYDTVIVETSAARLTPASKLNTMLRLFSFDGTVLEAENDDLDGSTTDSRIETTLAGEGTYWIQVTGVGGSVGQYELSVDVRKSVNDDGTQCKPITIAVTPATKTLAPGETQQYTATATDASGNAFTDLTFVWLSGDQNVAIVDTTGLVTAVGGGTTTITAAGQGEPGYAEVNVTGPALGAPTQLAFSIQPASTMAGAAFSPAIEVEVRDANGNRVIGARNTVTLAIANNPGGATLSGTRTVNANLGVARFTGVFMDKAATGYTFTATSSSLTTATSSAFAIMPGAPSMLSFDTQPTTVEGNAAITPAVTTTILDAFGNVVTSGTNAVTIDFDVNIWASPFSPGSALFGTKTVNAVNGVASFPTLRVDKPGAGYTLGASATDLTPAVSGPFAVTLTVQSLGAGWSGHTCATGTIGTYCWGYNGNGQLGDGSTGSGDSVPRLVTSGPAFTQVVAGAAHTCALTAAGVAYCWGSNGYGQLGDNSTTQRTAPVAVAGGITFDSLSAGYYHTCGVAGTALYCWGLDTDGQLGDDASFANKSVPTVVAGGQSWASVSAGQYHTCALTTAGDAYCWGQDTYGQLGNDASFTGSGTPVIVAGSRTWDGISAGGWHTCGVDAGGVGYCWGANYDGRLGVDTTAIADGVHQPTPVAVYGGLTWSTLRAGQYHSCGLTSTGSAYCFGYNGDGQIGDGTFTSPRRVRTLVVGEHTFTDLRVGSRHNCGLNGTEVWCWGRGSNGQLGNGARVASNEPVQIVQ
jgi:alpha-tubulin suppressor-like RCC1 family protein